MFKRIIKIILILLAVFLLVLGIIWLIGRHTAEKSGTKVLSFKQFIGLSSKESTSGNGSGSGTNSASFTGSGNGSGSGSNNGAGNGANSAGGIGDSGVGDIGDVTNVSNFTGGELAPTGVDNIGTGDNGNGTPGNSNNGNTNNNNGDNGSGGSSTGGSTAPVCGTADTTINFTPLQISELNALQNRFYSIAEALHTDQDTATELANHDAFALKAAQVTEMYNYCESKLPLITDPNLQQRVATPFWDAWNTSSSPANQFWDVNGIPQGTGTEQVDSQSLLYFPPGSATETYLTQTHDNDQQNPDTSGISGPYGQYSFSNPGYVIIDGSILNPPAVLLMPVVEHILRVNLW
jgi:hypothetical protein